MTAVEVTDDRPLLAAVFTKPREAIDRILASQSRHLVLPLAALGGIAFFVGRFLNTGLVFNFVNWGILLILAVSGVIVGVGSLYLTALIFSWIGRFGDGRASPFQLRAAWAWSFLPSILGCLVIALILMTAKAFDPDRLMVRPELLVVVNIITSASRIWGWIVFLVMVSQVHRLAVWQALVTCAIGMGSIFAIAIPVRAMLGYLLNIPPILFNVREYVLEWLP
jgi:hypothetical protein